MPPGALDAATIACLDLGIMVLQGFRLAVDDRTHVAALLDYMAPAYGSHWADIGCGFGAPARIMSELRPDLRFVLINGNALQLSFVPPQMRTVLADMHEIPLPDGAVDGCLFLWSLCQSPDTQAALREAARITRPGGELFVFDHERLRGDNAAMRALLCAEAFPFAALESTASSAGWRVTLKANPAGSDTLFRSLFPDQRSYDAIFDDLRPVVWKAER